MYTIELDPDLRARLPGLRLGVLRARVTNSEHDPDLWRHIQQQVQTRERDLAVEAIGGLSAVSAQRAAYKATGKDPRRYRGAAEALLRRVVQGKGLYRVNTLVDINNLVSLETAQPLGSYDTRHLEPPLTFRIGQPDEPYESIGRGGLNIAGLPVLADRRGAFGSPTSDSARSSIRLDTRYLLVVVYAFDGQPQVALARMRELLVEFAGAVDEV